MLLGRVAKSFTVGVGFYVIFSPPPSTPPPDARLIPAGAACTLDNQVGAAVGSHRVV